MSVPPVFCVDDLTPALLGDLRDAAATYGTYAYTTAFDDVILLPERRLLISAYLRGEVAPLEMAEALREWILRRWSSTRSLRSGYMTAIGEALRTARPLVMAIAPDSSLETADQRTLAQMAAIFQRLDDCAGVGATIASKLLAPLRPALFPMWDNPIAWAYGIALNAAGYHQYLNVTQRIARRARELFWGPAGNLEQYLKRPGRVWTAPLAKVLDEWNWVRITRRHRYEGRRGEEA